MVWLASALHTEAAVEPLDADNPVHLRRASMLAGVAAR